MRALARACNLEASSSFERLESPVDALRTGRADAALGVLLSDPSASGLALTTPYQSDRYTLFARRGGPVEGLDDLPAARIAVVSGNSAIESYLAQSLPGAETITAPTLAAALKLVAGSEADCAILPQTHAARVAAAAGLDAIVAIGRPLATAEYRIALRPHDTDLLFTLNEGLRRLESEGTLARLREQWGREEKMDGLPKAVPSPLYFAAAIAALAFAMLTALWWLAAERRVLMRTASLADENTLLRAVLDAVPARMAWKGADLSPIGANRLWREAPDIPSLGPSEELQEDRAALSGEPRTAILAAGDGSFRSLRLRVEDDGGKALGLLRIDLDREEELRLEDELRALTASRAKERLAASRAAMSDLQSGLFSRACLEQRLEDEIVAYNRQATPLSAVVVDIAGILGPSSARGYEAEDAELRLSAEALRVCLRDRDYPGRLSCSRFIALLPCTRKPEAEEVAWAIRESFLPRPPGTPEGAEGGPDGGAQALRVAAIEYAGQGARAFLAEAESALAAAEPARQRVNA